MNTVKAFFTFPWFMVLLFENALVNLVVAALMHFGKVNRGLEIDEGFFAFSVREKLKVYECRVSTFTMVLIAIGWGTITGIALVELGF